MWKEIDFHQMLLNSGNKKKVPTLDMELKGVNVRYVKTFGHIFLFISKRHKNPLDASAPPYQEDSCDPYGTLDIKFMHKIPFNVSSNLELVM